MSRTSLLAKNSTLTLKIDQYTSNKGIELLVTSNTSKAGDVKPISDTKIWELGSFTTTMDDKISNAFSAFSQRSKHKVAHWHSVSTDLVMYSEPTSLMIQHMLNGENNFQYVDTENVTNESLEIMYVNNSNGSNTIVMANLTEIVNYFDNSSKYGTIYSIDSISGNFSREGNFI